MLIKVQYRGLKKYLKLQPGFSNESFIEVIWRGPLQTRDINLLVQERTPLPQGMQQKRPNGWSRRFWRRVQGERKQWRSIGD
ncbi:hypothetical protein AALO_G00115100 [Alosa alosa]|uniref:Uncharacterized protein n=1 Tax=Alosa alosa TaxID=278164 RepID=A0AAV6GV13_9TELE|nr:hypothetical protein AALO_G00115100 [Alosa alosa]